eukprot:gene23476-biopygen20821
MARADCRDGPFAPLQCCTAAGRPAQHQGSTAACQHTERFDEWGSQGARHGCVGSKCTGTHGGAAIQNSISRAAPGPLETHNSYTHPNCVAASKACAQHGSIAPSRCLGPGPGATRGQLNMQHTHLRGGGKGGGEGAIPRAWAVTPPPGDAIFVPIAAAGSVACCAGPGP